jgi:hypothetical protein
MAMNSGNCKRASLGRQRVPKGTAEVSTRPQMAYIERSERNWSERG